MLVRQQGRIVRWVSPTGRLVVANPADGDAQHGHRADVVVHAPSKLNLFLKVLGPRPDGYHSLETVMVALGLYDTLVFDDDESADVRLRCHQGGFRQSSHSADGELPTGSDNLVVRAAELLRQRTGCEQGASIRLIKRIPVRAGLGGGSSDAAATLVGLARLWELDLPHAALKEMAAQLGSDVNFFLDSPAAAVCRGRGELVESVALTRRIHAVVVCPRSGLATADVFRAWSSAPAPNTQRAEYTAAQYLQVFRCGGLFRHGRETVWNDLEAPARRLNPELDTMLTDLRQLRTGPVGMSGSGTSCFTLCRNRTQAGRLAMRLRRTYHDRVVAVECRS